MKNKILFFVLVTLTSISASASISVWSCDEGLNIEFKSEKDLGTVYNQQGMKLGKLKKSDFDSESGYMIFKGKTYECSYSGEK